MIPVNQPLLEGYISPVQFEHNWFAAQMKDAA